MANIRFEFSDMNHPTAGDPVGGEAWQSAPAFYEAELHWLLGHTPDYIECYFHAADQRQFPWTRVRAYDENGVIGIWRFDTIEEQFEATQRVWRAVGRCVLYGAVDNYMRSPRIKADQAMAEGDPDLDDDPGYTEWPIIPPKLLVTLEDLEHRFAEDHFRVRSCATLIEETGCGGALSPCSGGGDEEQDCDTGEHSHGNFPYCHPDGIIHTGSQEAAYLAAGSPCIYDRNTDRDEFLLNNFAESRYNVEESKLGPNYVWKGVRRGWVFKDILRHSAGTHSAASRPILGVYNRTKVNDNPITDEGNPIRSNFQQSQVAGAGSSALAYDVAVSWPWIIPEDTSEIERQALGEYEGDSGYDYRTVWPGKTDTYAPSGQAVEIFQRGSEEWDDEQMFACPGMGPPCPDVGPDDVKTYLVYFQTQTVQKFVEISGYPTRDVICANKPGAAHINIAGMGVLVMVIDTGLASYDVSPPLTINEWLGRFPDWLPLTGPGLSSGGANGNIICSKNGVPAQPCWCESHCYTVTAPSGSLTYCSGLLGLWMTPVETVTFNPPDEFKCKELDPSRNIAVFLHKEDVSKDYLCYHKIP